MPDDNQIPSATAQVPSTQSDQGQTAQQPADQAVQVPVQQPVSTPVGKEQAPIAIPQPQEQWVQETAPEARVAKEVQEAGVEASKSEVIHVTPEIQQAGVHPMGTAVPIPTEPKIQLPIPEARARSIVKMHKKVRDSVTWLALLIVRQLQIFQRKQDKERKTIA